MTATSPFRLSVAFFVACMAILSVPAIAAAENPFSSDDDTSEPEQRSAAPDHEPSALLRRTVYDAGRWSLGIDGFFSRTSTRADMIEEDGEMTDTTRFMRIDPWVTVGIIDQLHVGLIAGFVSRRLSTEIGDGTTDNAFAFQPMGQYYLPATPRLALYAQLAPGMYFGSSERTIFDPDNEEELLEDEDTSTLGFVLSTGIGLNYRLTEGLQIRFGLTFNGLWGRERVDATDDRLFTSTTNVGTNAGLRYTF